jgi:ParB family chromosome partitioning protein
MADDVHMIPIDAIDETALVRDRTALDPEALAELKASVAAGGVRMPVEVFVPAAPRDGRTHGLISGFRRLAAVRALHAETGEARFAAVPAFLRAPADLAAALAAMVEENDVREELSAWDRARVVVVACRMQLFASLEAAVDGLHPAADRHKRTRLRAMARAVEALDGQLSAPERLSQAELMRLAAACRAGLGPAIVAALAEVRVPQGADAAALEWEAVLPVLAEAERGGADAAGPPPCRVLQLRRELTLRREAIPGGWLLRFTGRDATLMQLEPVFDDLETLLWAR